MTNPIDRRLDRLETEVQKRTDPGYGPIFTLIDDPYDPDNPRRLEEARRKPNWRVSQGKKRERWLAAYDRYNGLKNTFQEPVASAEPR